MKKHNGARLPPDISERLRRKLVEELLPRFDGNQSELARTLGYSSQAICRAANGYGGSLGMVLDVAKYLNDDPRELLLGEPSAPPKVRSYPGFAEAVDEALRKYPHLTPRLFEKLGDVRIELGADSWLTPEFLFELAVCYRMRP
ncbi:MAG TPA: hypothetical protein VFQ61_06415 [Polyangiaceae bacterium]|nr:hypothetical protein [Polyangiaceae bacterium]